MLKNRVSGIRFRVSGARTVIPAKAGIPEMGVGVGVSVSGAGDPDFRQDDIGEPGSQRPIPDTRYPIPETQILNRQS